MTGTRITGRPLAGGALGTLTEGPLAEGAVGTLAGVAGGILAGGALTGGAGGPLCPFSTILGYNYLISESS